MPKNLCLGTYDQYLTSMNINMYLLNTKTEDAFWIPDGAQTEGCQQYPWCLTWEVLNYTNMGTYTLEVGASQDYETVSGAVQANSSLTNTEIQLNASVTEKQEILVSAGMSVMARGATSTLDGQDRKSVV